MNELAGLRQEIIIATAVALGLAASKATVVAAWRLFHRICSPEINRPQSKPFIPKPKRGGDYWHDYSKDYPALKGGDVVIQKQPDIVTAHRITNYQSIYPDFYAGYLHDAIDEKHHPTPPIEVPARIDRRQLPQGSIDHAALQHDYSPDESYD